MVLYYLKLPRAAGITEVVYDAASRDVQVGGGGAVYGDRVHAGQATAGKEGAEVVSVCTCAESEGSARSSLEARFLCTCKGGSHK